MDKRDAKFIRWLAMRSQEPSSTQKTFNGNLLDTADFHDPRCADSILSYLKVQDDLVSLDALVNDPVASTLQGTAWSHSQISKEQRESWERKR